MKKSNKILLVIFLTIFLLLGGIHISLMAKYKSGEFTAFEDVKVEEALHLKTHPLKKNAQIRIENIGSVNIHLSEKPIIKYPKDLEHIKITKQDGVVVITGNYDNNEEMQQNINVELYVDSTMLVSLKNSNAFLLEGSSSNQNLQLNLDNARFGTTHYGEEKLFTIGNLSIQATNDSHVNLSHLRINLFSINLQKSAFNESNSTINQLMLQADDSSHISLSSANFLKITKTNINE